MDAFGMTVESDTAEPTATTSLPRASGWWRPETLPPDVEAGVHRQILAIERVTLRVRVWIAVLGCLMGVLNWGSNELVTTIATLSIGAVYGVAAYALLHVRWRVTWVVVTLDALTLVAFSMTSLTNHSGAYELLLAPHFVIMALLLMLLSVLHFEVRITVWAGALAAMLRLVTFLAIAPRVTLVTQAVYGERAVGIADQITIVALYAGFGALAAVVTHFSRRLLVRTTRVAVRAAVLEHAQANFRRYLGDAMMRDIAAGVEETLFSRSLDGMLVVGADGRVLVANAAAERLVHVSPLVERGVNDALPAREVAGFLSHLARGRLRADRHEFTSLGEPTHFIESRATALHDGAVFLTLRDVTERRRFEQGLVRAARMESVGHLAGGLAHDFNNVLAGLVGHLHLLRVDKGISPGGVARLDRMEQLVARATGMARRLLVLGRGGTARSAVTPEALIHAAVELVRGALPADLRLEIVVGDGLPTLLASAREVEECLVNLLLNARDASPPEGLIVIGAVTREGMVEFTVDDEGPGIGPGERLRIFEPFYSTKSATGGTGLGLAVVARVVRDHGGTVDIAPDWPRGTRVVMRLPVGRTPDDRESAVDDTGGFPLVGRTRRVLVVDDEETVRESVAAMLVLAGYEVNSAESGPKAWESLTNGGADVLVTDVAMPGETGFELAARAVQRFPDLGVVVMTGFTTGLQDWPHVRDGSWSCLAKPFQTVELLDAVATRGARSTEHRQTAR